MITTTITTTTTTTTADNDDNNNNATTTTTTTTTTTSNNDDTHNNDANNNDNNDNNDNDNHDDDDDNTNINNTNDNKHDDDNNNVTTHSVCMHAWVDSPPQFPESLRIRRTQRILSSFLPSPFFFSLLRSPFTCQRWAEIYRYSQQFWRLLCDSRGAEGGGSESRNTVSFHNLNRKISN